MNEKDMVNQSKIFSDLDDDLKVNKKGKGVMLDSDDLNKWELDTDPFIDNIYHELLGEVLVNRSWVRDPNNRVIRIMNEKGASYFKGEIRARVNRHMAISDLNDETIKMIIGEASENFAFLIFDHYEEWDIDQSTSTYQSITDRLFHILLENLNTALDGGMRHHKEKRNISGVTKYIPQGFQGHQGQEAY